MKKKIGELYDKPIVIGNKNKVKKHEIHIDELSVPQEGGGAENWEYLDLSNASITEKEVLAGSCYKAKINEMSAIMPSYICAGNEGKVDALMLNMQDSIVYMGVEVTVKDAILQSLTADQLAAIPRITEEEFYNLETA